MYIGADLADPFAVLIFMIDDGGQQAVCDDPQLRWCTDIAIIDIADAKPHSLGNGVAQYA